MTSSSFSEDAIAGDLGARLLAVRRMMNLSQAEMAKKLDVSHRSYIHYEQGTREPGASVLRAIGLHFDIDAEWLLFGANALPIRRGGPQLNMEVLALALDGIIATCKELPEFPASSQIADALMAYYQKLVQSGYGSDKAAHDRRKSLLAA